MNDGSRSDSAGNENCAAVVGRFMLGAVVLFVAFLGLGLYSQFQDSKRSSSSAESQARAESSPASPSGGNSNAEGPKVASDTSTVPASSSPTVAAATSTDAMSELQSLREDIRQKFTEKFQAFHVEKGERWFFRYPGDGDKTPTWIAVANPHLYVEVTPRDGNDILNKETYSAWVYVRGDGYKCLYNKWDSWWSDFKLSGFDDRTYRVRGLMSCFIREHDGALSIEFMGVVEGDDKALQRALDTSGSP